jgi:hypothetical protein
MKKFTITLPRSIVQQDRFLSQDTKITIIKISTARLNHKTASVELFLH